MTQSNNIDMLFQMTAALFERTPSVEAIVSGDQPAFDQHLANASATSQNDTTSSRSRSNSTTLQPTEDRRSAAQSADATNTKGEASQTTARDYGTCGPGAKTPDCSVAPTQEPRDDATAEPTTAEADGETATDVDAEGERDLASEPQHPDDELSADVVVVIAEQALAPANVGENGAADRTNDTAADSSDEVSNIAISSATDDHVAASPVGPTADNAQEIAATEIGNAGPDVHDRVHDPSKLTPHGEFLPQSKQVVTGAPNLTPVSVSGQTTSTATSALSPANGQKEGRHRKTDTPTEAAGVVPDGGGVSAAASRTVDVAEPSGEGIRDRRGIRAASRRGATNRTDNNSARGNEEVNGANKTPVVVAARPFSVVSTGDGLAESEGQARPAGRNSTAAKNDSLTHNLTRSQRPHAANGRSVRRGGTTNLPHVDATKFVGRVAKAVQTAHERGGALQLRLSPPELGSLRLQLVVENGAITASLETENAAARQVLLDHLPALRERLAEQNIRIERFDVDVRHEGSSGQSDGRPAQQGQHDQRSHHTPARNPLRTPAVDETSRSLLDIPLRPSNGGLNVLA